VIIRHYKKILAVLLIAAALAAVRLYQAPVHPGAVLDAFTVASSTPGRLKLVFFDVGQGDAALIITPGGQDILVDGGPDNKVVQKLGEYLPYTDRKIEYVILTHPHADHLVGLVETLKRYEVGRILMTGVVYSTAEYEKFLELAEEKNIPIDIIEQPETIAIDGVDLAILAPQISWNGRTIANLNNSSIAFKLVYGSSSALYMGDLEDEESLLGRSSSTLTAEVLKVGHHGSANANDRKFLAAVSPKFAIISVGAGNTYGLPSYRTIFYLKQLSTRIFRTDEDGDIGLTSDGSAFSRLVDF